MSVHIDNHGRLHHDQEQHLAITCSHCEVFSHITPLAVPQYDQLVAFHPKQIGIVFRCDSCNAPVFLRFNVKMYGANRVELATTFVELERAREKFSFTYLPEEAEVLRAISASLGVPAPSLLDAGEGGRRAAEG